MTSALKFVSHVKLSAYKAYFIIIFVTIVQKRETSISTSTNCLAKHFYAETLELQKRIRGRF